MILCANAIEVLAHTDLGQDVLITDPPYSAHVHSHAVSTRTDGAGPRKRDLGFAGLTDELRAAIAEAAAATPRWTVIFSDLESIHAWQQAMQGGAEYIRTLPWIRWSQPQISGDRPPTGAEAVLHFHGPGAKHWNGWGGLTHYDSRAMRGQYKHPTEKPLDLMLEIVSSFSDTGERVLDPCCGSGTTGVACRLLGREFVGIEADESWAAQAEARETYPLSARDEARAKEWAEMVCAQVGPMLSSEPGPNERKAWERAKRRFDGAERVRKELKI